MRNRKKIINKQIYKLCEGKCRICGECDYATLDVHRIKEGHQGGRYSVNNSVVLCCKCHRKVHDDQIKIIGYFLASNGKYMLLIEQNGEEKFI